MVSLEVVTAKVNHGSGLSAFDDPDVWTPLGEPASLNVFRLAPWGASFRCVGIDATSRGYAALDGVTSTFAWRGSSRSNRGGGPARDQPAASRPAVALGPGLSGGGRHARSGPPVGEAGDQRMGPGDGAGDRAEWVTVQSAPRAKPGSCSGNASSRGPLGNVLASVGFSDDRSRGHRRAD
jgi:hypothetical protein